MYCRHCGNKTLNGALYCQHDGSPVLALYEEFQIKKDSINLFCSNCSSENGKTNLYCISCGSSLDKILDKSNLIKKSPTVETFHPDDKRLIFDTNQEKPYIKKLWNPFLYSFISFMISFFLSWTISSVLNDKIKGYFLPELGYILSDLSIGIAEKLKIISSTDVLMLSHIVGLRFDLMISYFNGSIETSGGLFILMIIPMVSLLIVGYWVGQKSPNKSAMERITSTIPIAITYAILIALVSLFAGVSVDESIYEEWISLKTNYNFGDVFLHSLIISFVFTSIGSLLSLPKGLKGIGSNLTYGISIKRALVTTFSGVTICVVIVFGYLFFDEEFINDKMPNFEKVAIATQLGGYSWNLSHFNSLSINGGTEDHRAYFSYSLLTGLESSDLFSLSSSDVEERENIDYVWLIFIVPLILHILSGRQLRSTTSGKLLFELGAYAVAFGIISAMLAYNLKLSFYADIDEIINFNFGISLIQTFLLSSIIALIGSSIGWFIFSRRSHIIH